MKNIEDQIIYEDQHIIVCRKEAGVPVQTARMGQMDMESMLKNYLARKAGDGKMPYLAVLHRLDQPVCGVLVFAKTPFAAKEINKQITNHTMGKYYLAEVEKPIEKEEDTLVDYLIKDGKTNTSRIGKEGMKDAKRAELLYKKVGPNRVKIQLITGRHHQIRVQMAGANMPLVGDRKYNPEGDAADGKLRLCAYEVEFQHPKTKKTMKFAYCQDQDKIFE